MKYQAFFLCLQALDRNWTAEHRFHETRKWRFDFANANKEIAIEIDGGIWIRGRHSRGAGQLADMEKINEATRMGWRVYRFTPQQVHTGEAITYIKSLR